MREKTEEEIIKLLKDMGCEVKELSLSPRELGVTSLQMAEFLARTEEGFSVEFDLDEMDELWYHPLAEFIENILEKTAGEAV